MTDKHPITPPPELVQQWLGEQYGVPTAPGEATSHVATKAAQWGADQELEACREVLRGEYNWHHLADFLFTSRRPKPPSLKEQALAALEDDDIDVYLIRRAIEALPND